MPIKPFEEYGKAEQDFIDQMTRKMLVDWANEQVLLDPALRLGITLSVYRDYAKSKGWLGKDGQTVTAKGFQTAAAFLKR